MPTISAVHCRTQDTHHQSVSQRTTSGRDNPPHCRTRQSTHLLRLCVLKVEARAPSTAESGRRVVLPIIIVVVVVVLRVAVVVHRETVDAPARQELLLCDDALRRAVVKHEHVQAFRLLAAVLAVDCRGVCLCVVVVIVGVDFAPTNSAGPIVVVVASHGRFPALCNVMQSVATHSWRQHRRLTRLTRRELRRRVPSFEVAVVVIIAASLVLPILLLLFILVLLLCESLLALLALFATTVAALAALLEPFVHAVEPKSDHEEPDEHVRDEVERGEVELTVQRNEDRGHDHEPDAMAAAPAHAERERAPGRAGSERRECAQVVRAREHVHKPEEESGERQFERRGLRERGRVARRHVHRGRRRHEGRAVEVTSTRARGLQNEIPVSTDSTRRHPR